MHYTLDYYLELEPVDRQLIMLSCNNLSLTNNLGVVFSDLSFTMLPGSFMAIRGKNGSGKTSLLKMILGKVNYGNGSITWNNIDIQEDINELEELKSEYNDSPSEQGRNILIKESIQIADDIQDWLEKDLDEDEENPNSFVENINENNSSSKPNWKFW